MPEREARNAHNTFSREAEMELEDHLNRCRACIRNSEQLQDIPHIINVEWGMCMTTGGYIVHWNDSYNADAYEHLLSGVREDSFFGVYTSAVLRKLNLSENLNRTFLDKVINYIAADFPDIIKRVNVAQGLDLIFSLADSEMVKDICRVGTIQVKVGNTPKFLP